MAVKSSKRKLRRETRSSVEFQGIGWMEEIIFVFYYKIMTEMRKTSFQEKKWEPPPQKKKPRIQRNGKSIIIITITKT